MIKILMIEDDPEFAELLTEYLAQFDIKVTNFEDPFLGLSAGVYNYDLMILDLTLPGMDGLEVCEEAARKYDIPIIISSARSDINDKIASFELGADDYLPKPYDPKELHARILSLLRRRTKGDSIPKASKSDFETKGETIYFKGEALHLTPAEFEILSQLTHTQPRPFPAFVGRYHKRRPTRGLVSRFKAEGPRLDSASALLFLQKGCGLWTVLL